MPPLPDLDRVTTLLCDADGILFPSEEPAFAASAGVTNALLERIGSPRRWTPEELRHVALGRNFRSLAEDLLVEERTTLPAAELETWVAREQREVTAHLGGVLVPDPAVRSPLERLARRYALALVSSSALARLDVCLGATGLAGLFPPRVRTSAQDSLPAPSSKPDPAVYVAALAGLGLEPVQALAVEDAVSGVRSAVGAGIRTAGNLVFVPEPEREAHEAALLDAGAAVVVRDWHELERLLLAQGVPLL